MWVRRGLVEEGGWEGGSAERRVRDGHSLFPPRVLKAGVVKERLGADQGGQWDWGQVGKGWRVFRVLLGLGIEESRGA